MNQFISWCFQLWWCSLRFSGRALPFSFSFPGNPFTAYLGHEEIAWNPSRCWDRVSELGIFFIHDQGFQTYNEKLWLLRWENILLCRAVLDAGKDDTEIVKTLLEWVNRHLRRVIFGLHDDCVIGSYIWKPHLLRIYIESGTLAWGRS